MKLDVKWGERKDIPEGMHDVAMRRVAFLHVVAMTRQNVSLTALFASAYLQGIEDAADAIQHKETHNDDDVR